MTKIKLIFTGGTIASAATEKGILPVSDNTEPIILRKFKESYPNINNKTEFDCEIIMNKLSENMELSDWEHILSYLKNTDFKAYDGIIITHGTDTLAYFAALLSVFEKNLPPVYIVSSDKVLEDKTANGLINFLFAVNEIISGEHQNGIYVPYRNTNGIITVHKGYQIIQSEILSDNFFSADSVPPRPKNLKNFLGFKKGVVILNCYVGMDFSLIDLKKVTSVIIKAYHGGTTNESEILKLLSRLKSYGASAPSLMLASVNYPDKEKQYSSTVRLENQGVKIVYKKTLETVYAEELCSLVN